VLCRFEDVNWRNINTAPFIMLYGKRQIEIERIKHFRHGVNLFAGLELMGNCKTGLDKFGIGIEVCYKSKLVYYLIL